MKALWLIGSILCIASTGQPALAQSWCTYPNKPYCADGYGAFRDNWEFQSCRGEVERYQSDVEDYLRCRKREADSLLTDLQSVIQSFNARTR